MNIKQNLMLLFAAVTLFSCFRNRTITGSGNIKKEKRQTGSFTGIDVESVVDVEVRNGPVAEVVVEADDNLVPYIYTEVKGDNLVISIRKMNSFRNCTFKVYVTAPEVESISNSGTGTVTTDGVLKNSNSISLSSSGAGNMDVNVDAPSVDADVSGAGKIVIQGRTKNYKAELSGAGSISSYDLLSEKAEAEVSGVGNIKLHASVSLKATVSGAGDIRYRGDAAVESSISGVGKVTKE